MALLKRPPTEPAAPTTLREASSAWADLDDKEKQLNELIRDLEAEQSRLTDELRERPSDGGAGERVAELLGDDTSSRPDPRARLNKIGLKIADARAALRVVAGRKQAERFVASRVICDAVRPAYITAVGELADALIAAHAAHQKVNQITGRLSQADVAWVGHLPPMQATHILGEPHDDQSRTARWLGAAADLGAIKPSAIPEFKYVP